MIRLFVILLWCSVLGGCTTLMDNMGQPRPFGGMRTIHRNFRRANVIMKSLFALDYVPSLIGDALLAPAKVLASSALDKQELPDEDYVVAVIERPTRRYFTHTILCFKDGPGSSWTTTEVQEIIDVRSVDGERRRYRRTGVSWSRRGPPPRLSTRRRLVATLTGERAMRAIPRIRQLIDEYRDDESGIPSNERQFDSRNGYRAWPGPNSNTYIDYLGRNTPHLAFELSPRAIGKDYAHWVRAGWTTTKSGLEVESPYLGIQFGFFEGIELHLLQFPVGISLFPPSLKLPLIGRLGFQNRILR